MKRYVFALITVFALSGISLFAEPSGRTVTWTTMVSNVVHDWNNAANWDNGVPQEGDDVVIANNIRVNILLSETTPVFNSFSIQSGRSTPSKSYPQILIFTNWTTCLRAKSVTVGIGGKITHAGPYTYSMMSNRVWIAADDLEVAYDGEINADNLGSSQKPEQEPTAYIGGCYSSGAAMHSDCLAPIYAGRPASYSKLNRINPVIYGSVEYPADPGSSGCIGNSHGGGVIFLDVKNTVRIDGIVSANSANSSTGISGGGTGGSVLIVCDKITGAGVVQANSKICYKVESMQNNFAGGGGRLAVHYNPSSQQAENGCDIRFEAMSSVYLGTVKGASDLSTRDDTETIPLHWPRALAMLSEDNVAMQGMGSVYFTDDTFLRKYRNWKFAGRLYTGSPIGDLDFADDVTFTNCQLLVHQGGFNAVFRKSVDVYGTGALARRETGVIFSNVNVKVVGDLKVAGSRFGIEGGSLLVQGDVVHERSDFAADFGFLGGEIVARAAPTNAPGQFGAVITVEGDWHIKTGGVVRVECDEYNGSVVKIVAKKNLLLDRGGWINSDQGGWRYGPGSAMNFYPGASYGGRGSGVVSEFKEVYGDRENPLLPGSGGGEPYDGGYFRGGGVVLMDVYGVLTLNGIISANSNRRIVSGYATPGSGGAVNIRAMGLKGNGKITALGGHSNSLKQNLAAGYAAGGGGRIAVRTNPMRTAWTEEMKAANLDAGPGWDLVWESKTKNPVGRNSETYAEAGTVYWGNWGTGFSIIVK